MWIPTRMGIHLNTLARLISIFQLSMKSRFSETLVNLFETYFSGYFLCVLMHEIKKVISRTPLPTSVMLQALPC